MAKSMTGFGAGECREEGFSISVEVRTINHKYLDMNIRIPRNYSFLEDRMRDFIKKSIFRGRTEVFVKADTTTSFDIDLKYDGELARKYFDILKKINSDFSLSKEITAVDISKFPEVITVEDSKEDEDKMWSLLKKALDISIENLCEMRNLEGKKLVEDIEFRADLLMDYIKDIEDNSHLVVEEYRDRLKKRLSELLEGEVAVDETRLSQEVAIYADKSNITEEIVRFKSHIIQLRQNLKKEEPIGRRLDFIIQEMNREVNTIGSKSSDIKIADLVIQIKSELEKIREQVQNIE